MKTRHLGACALCVALLAPTGVFAESVLGGLEEFGHELNHANNWILNKLDPPTYSEMMRRYRQLEYERVLEFSAVSGVAPEVIRQMRARGESWYEIGEKYDINVNTLPEPVLPKNYN